MQKAERVIPSESYLPEEETYCVFRAAELSFYDSHGVNNHCAEENIPCIGKGYLTSEQSPKLKRVWVKSVGFHGSFLFIFSYLVVNGDVWDKL